jgi:hypothetical protein
MLVKLISKSTSAAISKNFKTRGLYFRDEFD